MRRDVRKHADEDAKALEAYMKAMRDKKRPRNIGAWLMISVAPLLAAAVMAAVLDSKAGFVAAVAASLAAFFIGFWRLDYEAARTDEWRRTRMT